MTVSGTAGHVSVSHIIGLYYIIQCRMADSLASATASETRVNVEVGEENIRLVLSDNVLMHERAGVDESRGSERLR